MSWSLCFFGKLRFVVLFIYLTTLYVIQEMVRLMREKRFPAAFKCYHNYHKINSISNDNLHIKMVIHVHSDSAFRRYQKEMRSYIFLESFWTYCYTKNGFIVCLPHIVHLNAILTCIWCFSGTSQICGLYIEVNGHDNKLIQLRCIFITCTFCFFHHKNIP